MIGGMNDDYEVANKKTTASNRSRNKVSRRALLVGATAAGVGAVAGGGLLWWRPFVGSDGSVRVPYTAVHRDAVPVGVSSAGEPVYQPVGDSEGERMQVLDDYTLYAPMPSEQVRDRKECNNKASGIIPAGVPGFGWLIPELGVGTKVVASGSSAGRLVLPVTTDGSGVWYEKSNPLTATAGSTILAGHVNRRNYYLSPWGYLHRLGGCEHLFLGDGSGGVSEWCVSDVFTVPQSELGEVAGMWDKGGVRSLWLVTCSGRQVGEDGAAASGSTFGFGYEYNLVVRCVPCG